MEKLDKELAEHLNKQRDIKTRQKNANKTERETYQKDDLVWILKPNILNSQSKMESRWKGPLQVLNRVGEHSYIVGDKKGGTQAVHIDQMKTYQPLGEMDELVGLETSKSDIEQILGNQRNEKGEEEYLIWWKEDPRSEASWIPEHQLQMLGHTNKIQQYWQTKRGAT